MSKRVTNQYAIVFSITEGAEEELKKVLKALMTYIKKQAITKGYSYKLEAVGSIHKQKTAIRIKEPTYSPGRPKETFLDHKIVMKAEPHIHILIKSNPGETLIKEMKKYTTKKKNIKTKSFKYKYANSGILGYMETQASFTRRATYDPDNIIGEWS